MLKVSDLGNFTTLRIASKHLSSRSRYDAVCLAQLIFGVDLGYHDGQEVDIEVVA